MDPKVGQNEGQISHCAVVANQILPRWAFRKYDLQLRYEENEANIEDQSFVVVTLHGHFALLKNVKRILRIEFHSRY